MDQTASPLIAYTGPTGSLGSQMPAGPQKLVTRLEQDVLQMVTELRGLPVLPRTLVHLSGLVNVAECEQDPQRAWQRNVVGSLKWYLAATEAGCERFVQVSTSHVYARPQGRQPVPVDAPLDPRSIYGKTKLEAEQALQSVAAGEPERLPVELRQLCPATIVRASSQSLPRLVIARVFSVLSPAMRPGYLLTRLHERARQRDFSPIPGLDHVRDFLQAEEVCRQLLHWATAPDPPAIVHVCSGRATTVRQVAEQVFRAHGLDPAGLCAGPTRPDDVPCLVGVPSLPALDQPQA